jgi:hypothetical protein
MGSKVQSKAHKREIQISRATYLFFKKNYNTTQQILCGENNQRFLLNFGALRPNLFLDFSQH